MKKRKNFVLCTVIGLSLAGCAAPAMNENMVVTTEQTRSISPSNKFYKNVKSIQVSGGSETVPFLTSQVGSDDFQKALLISLKNANMLCDAGKYTLKANLISLDQPYMGISMTVRASVDYLIKDEVRGEIILDETINSSFTANMSDNFLGVERLRVANEGAIRRNIELFLKKISKS